MPVRAENPLFQRQRVSAVFEHIDIVVAFEDDRVAAEDAAADFGGEVADVGRVADGGGARLYAVADRILRVVRGRERLHQKRTKLDRTVQRTQQTRRARAFGANGAAAEVGRVNRDGEGLGNRLQPLIWSLCSCVTKIARISYSDVPSACSDAFSARAETPASMRTHS